MYLIFVACSLENELHQVGDYLVCCSISSSDSESDFRINIPLTQARGPTGIS